MKKVLYPLLTIAALAVVSMLVATINIVIAQDLTPTPGPELPTAVPACEAYYVSVGSANVRSCANSSCPIVTQLAQNTSVCIRGVADNSTWFRIDLSPNDTTSELYFIFDGNVSQGSSSGALPVYSRCQPFLTNDAVTTRQCPSASCTASGTLGGGEFVCGREYTGQLAGWIFAEESESGVVGWLEAGQLSPSRNYDASAERFVPTPGSSGISNTSASNIIPGVAPAPFVIEGNRPVCQQYHVTAVGANVRECPGMACRVVSTIPLGTGICIRSTTLNPDWYAIDLTPQDPASPIYAISKDVVSPGTNPQPLEVAVCDLYEVRTSGPRALVRQCPSVTCPAVDALDNGNLVCATAYGGEFRDWIQVQLDTGLTEVWMHESVLRSKAAEQELAAAATEAALPPTPISTSIPLQSFVPSPTPAIPINISPTPIITSGGAPGVASTGGTDGTTNGGAVNLSGGGVISSTAVPQVAINPTATPMLLSTVPVVVQQATAFLPNTSADINVNPGITQSGLATPFLPQTGVAGGSQSAGLSPTQVAQVATPFFQPSTIPQQAPAGTPTLLFQPTAPPIVNNTFLTPTAPTTQQQITVTTGGLLAQEVTLTSLGVTDLQLDNTTFVGTFTFQLPANWVADGTNVLNLNLNYLELIPPTVDTNFTGPLVSTLDISINDILISTISLDRNTITPQTLAIPIPPQILAQRQSNRHTVRLNLDSRNHCLVSATSRLLVRSDLSFLHVEYRESAPVVDLAQYPASVFSSPLGTVRESVLLVLPAQPAQSDLQAALNVAAGLGNLTGYGVDLKLHTVDTLTDADRQTHHMILIGQHDRHTTISTLYAQNLLPTTRDPQGRITYLTQIVGSVDGIVQVIQSPQAPQRTIVVVTGSTPDGVIKASQALAGSPTLIGLRGPVAIVTGVRPPSFPASLPADVTLTQLGLPTINMNGVTSRSAFIEFFLPPGQRLIEGGYIDLIYNFSDVLASSQSSLSIFANGEIPLASTYLDNSQGAPIGGFRTLRAFIPSGSIRSGESNSLVLRLNTSSNWGCNRPDELLTWFTVSGDSLLHLPQETIDQSTVQTRVSSFPNPFNAQPDLSNVWVSLPTQPSLQELEQAFQLIALLASRTSGGQGFSPRLNIGDLPPGTDLSQYNFIVVGRPTANPFLASINPILPQPFLTGSDSLAQTDATGSLRVPATGDIGVLQMLKSPWQGGHRLLVVTGTSAKGQSDAASILVVSPDRITELGGDVVYVSNLNIVPVITRTENVSGNTP